MTIVQTIEATGAATSRVRREIAATFALSWPIVITNLAINLMTTTDVMWLGRLSPDALAAGALGFNIFLPIFLFGVGIVGAAAPLAASLVGAKPGDPEGPRRVAHQALISALWLAIPIWALLWNAAPILRAIGEPPNLAASAGIYMHGLQWALGPALLANALRSVFAAMGRTGAVLAASLIAVVFNALANYVLIFGHFGAPALGVFGSGLATTLSHSLMFMLLAGYSFLDPRLRALRLFAGPWRPHARELARLWRLGLPIGATIAAEVSVFSISALAMGLIGPDSIEAHSIVIQIAATAFMVPLGLGQAASVRVGHAFGARDRAGVARAGWTAFGMTMVFVAASAAVMFAAPRLLISAFIPIDLPANAAIVAIALSFTRVAAIFQVFDGGQAALANMLRGIHDSKQPMVMALTGYWAIGVPVSLALGFLTPLRGLGLWIGLAVGLAAVATMLLWRWLAKERVGFF
jgi:MATE family multidrug resistance protein